MTRAKLIIRTPRQPDQEVRLAGGASIGRAFDNTVRVEVDGVSRYHAIIEQKADGFWLSDLGSRNGTTVNGSCVSVNQKLGDGDALVLGGTATLQFHLERTETGSSGSGAAAAATFDPAKQAESNSQSFAGGKRAVLTGLGIVLVVVGVFVIAQLASSRSRVDRKPNETAMGDGGLSDRQPRNGEKPGGGSGNADAASLAGMPKTTVPGAESAGKETAAESPGPVELLTAQECQKLAGLIVNKNGSGYVFDPAFVADVLRHIDEYRIDMRDNVRTHRFQINKAFGATPLHKVTGYLLAISRSKFRDDPGDPGGMGLWRVPRSIALNYKTPEEPESIINQPDRSVDIAAQYLKSLINVFGPDDFMYAIACFGMPISAAGDLRNNLDKAGSIDRRDFWSMARKGVVPRDGVDRVVRFFAAGIAAENPVSGSQPLSWLISN